MARLHKAGGLALHSKGTTPLAGVSVLDETQPSVERTLGEEASLLLLPDLCSATPLAQRLGVGPITR
jgi:hypothetical protein